MSAASSPLRGDADERASQDADDGVRSRWGGARSTLLRADRRRPARTLSSRAARMLSGLRLRLLLALLATSVVTLAVAALTLLGPLEQRLREDGIGTVSAAMSAMRPAFALVPRTLSGTPDRRELQRLAFKLVGRTKGGQVAVLDSSLQAVAYAPDVHSANFPYRDYRVARETLATGRQTRRSEGESLTVAQRIHVAGRHYVVVVFKHLQYVSTAFKVVQNAFLVAALAGLATALLLGIGLASRLLRRLERLRDATRSVERDGLHAPFPSDPARDEIGELTHAFAAMRTRLRRQESARRAFVATASHELRTPLASLDGMLELLEDDLAVEPLDIADARVRAEHAREQTRRLSQLATDLLDISRLDSEVQLRAEPLELREIARAVAAEFERLAGKREVTLSVRGTDPPCWALADPGAVARIVRILIDNALRFAPPHTMIDVSPATATDRHVAEIVVADEGPGVPPEDREIIFERFTRGSSTSGGFGLGLAIGRELARRMGGELFLHDAPPAAHDGASPPAQGGASPPPACGARFVLRLPTPDEEQA